MELFEALQNRRSCRKYIDKDISEEDINKIMHAAMSGPSACNKRPWDFYIIKDKEILAKLRKASQWSNINGNTAIVAVGTLSRALPLQLQDFWIQDLSAATENILLAATALGLGSLWCGIFPMKNAIKNVQEALNLKEKQIPLNIIWLGYPAKESEPRDQYEEKHVHFI